MVDKVLPSGLSKEIVADLHKVFKCYPEIEQVLIFGSRAKGTFKNGSDIDLAVIAPDMSDQRFANLWNQLDDLPLIFEIDLLHWDHLNNEQLKDKILREGKVFYARYMEDTPRNRELGKRVKGRR